MNNDFFTIEGSFDGANWRMMHEIKGAGTTQETQNYSLSSSNPMQFEYFRLKQTDYDGGSSYSDIVAIQLIREDFSIFPNPSNGQELKVNLPSDDTGVLQILHSDGRIAYSRGLSGEKYLYLNYLNLKTGAYIIQVQQSNQLQTKRLIIH